MSKASERLRELALHMMVKDLDIQLPSGCINPEEAADLLDEAEKALDMVVAIAGLYGDDEKTLLDEEYQLPEVAAAITTLARIRGGQ